MDDIGTLTACTLTFCVILSTVAADNDSFPTHCSVVLSSSATSTSSRSTVQHGAVATTTAVTGEAGAAIHQGGGDAFHGAPISDYYHRPELYHIPPRNDPMWAVINHEISHDQFGKVRVLRSENVQGILVVLYDARGLARIADWTYVPQFLFFNPIEYFLHHPNIREVWIRTDDTSAYTNSSSGSDPGGVRTVSVASSTNSVRSNSRSGNANRSYAMPESNIALLCKRSELTYDSATIIHDHQAAFFTSHHIPLPSPHEFLHTLNGR